MKKLNIITALTVVLMLLMACNKNKDIKIIDPPCSFNYSAWSLCANNVQTRTYTSSPSGCIGTPPLDSIQRGCVSGYLIADFESGYNNLWTKFVQSGASMDCQIRNVKPIPQGDYFYNMAGTVNWDWLVSLIDFNANANGVDRFPLNTNPNNIYFNVMVWGEPGLDNSLLLFQFKEDDNTNGTFESSSEDEYDYQLKIDWSGWKLISIKYSDLGSLLNGEPVTPKGNKQRNPNNLVRLSILHLVDPSSGFAKTKIDYLIFTDLKSLEPW